MHQVKNIDSSWYKDHPDLAYGQLFDNGWFHLLFGVTSLALGQSTPDSKVHEAYMGPTWGRQDPGASHVGPMNLAFRDDCPCASEESLPWRLWVNESQVTHRI